jgi:hypothetical protein
MSLEDSIASRMASSYESYESYEEPTELATMSQSGASHYPPRLPDVVDLKIRMVHFMLGCTGLVPSTCEAIIISAVSLSDIHVFDLMPKY